MVYQTETGGKITSLMFPTEDMKFSEEPPKSFQSHLFHSPTHFMLVAGKKQQKTREKLH